uniref:Auxin-induced protein n=1 Tax=Rhizophora mucronata TaxID=61149 RepID=A0A2P2JVJ2_RHIMU
MSLLETETQKHSKTIPTHTMISYPVQFPTINPQSRRLKFSTWFPSEPSSTLTACRMASSCFCISLQLLGLDQWHRSSS